MADDQSAIDRRPIPLTARTDVVVQRILFRGEAYHVVKDPIALQYFHLQPTQHTVWHNLDGETSTEQIRTILSRQFPTLSIRGADVQRLATDLHRNGLTRSVRQGQSLRLDRRRRAQTRRKWLQAMSNPFFIKFPAINPSTAVDRCDRVFGSLLSKPGLVIGGLVIAASWIEAAVRFDALRATLPALQTFFGWPNLLWLWLMIGLTKIIHELGHAIACRRIGCRCHGIGAALLVFSPTLYCDATDSWICPRKWSRIGVSSAGMYVEVLLGAIAIFVWSHTHAGLLHSLALNVAAISTVSTVLFNANPLIRFDGYYILSDWIEIPNLQEKSSRLLYRSALWCLGLNTQPNPLDPKGGRVWFALFAVLSGLYRWFIMFAILITIYAMVRPYRVESIAGVWVMIVVIMTGTGITRSWINNIRSKKEEPIVKKRLFVTLVLLSALMIGFLSIPIPWWKRAEFEVAAVQPATVYAVVDGRVKQIHVSAGQAVQQGQLILELENELLNDEIRELETQKSLLQSEVQTLELAKKHADWIVKGQALRGVSRRLDELLPMQHSLQVRSPLDGVIVPPMSKHPSDSDQDSLPEWDGLALNTDNLGAVLEPGTPIALIVPSNEFFADIYIDQHDRQDLSVGQRVTLKLDAFPANKVASTISMISADRTDEIPRALSQRLGGRVPTTTTATGREQVDSRRYRVIVNLPADRRTLLGMRGQARFQLENRTVGQWLYRAVRSVFFFRM